MIHIFSPFNMYPSPTRRARVRMPPGFEPKSGSVSPKHPSFSPLASLGSHSSFCCGLPKVIDGIHHQRRLHADKAAQAGVAALQFLHHQAVLHIRHARAAIALNVCAKKSQLAHGLNQLARKASVPVALLDDGNQVVFDEGPGSVASHAFIVAEK